MPELFKWIDDLYNSRLKPLISKSNDEDIVAVANRDTQKTSEKVGKKRKRDKDVIVPDKPVKNRAKSTNERVQELPQVDSNNDEVSSRDNSVLHESLSEENDDGEEDESPASELPTKPLCARTMDKLKRNHFAEGNLSLPDVTLVSRRGRTADSQPSTSAVGEARQVDNWKDSVKRRDVKHGMFSAAEKDALRQALRDFALNRGLPLDVSTWLPNARSKGALGVINEISKVLPNRKKHAIWSCIVRIMHEGNYKGVWSLDEDEMLMKLVEEHGKSWTKIGDMLGRFSQLCRDRYRQIKMDQGVRKGIWNQEEVERLKVLVRESTEARREVEAQLNEEEREREQASGRMLIDNVDWDTVAEKMRSRNRFQCMQKWYSDTKPSFAMDEPEWGPKEDEKMLSALSACEAKEEWQVPWAQLMEGKSAKDVRRRWRLMHKAVPQARELEFEQCVAYVVDRYAPKPSIKPANEAEDE